MGLVSPYISIITLNENGLTLPIKRPEWIFKKKQKNKIWPYILPTGDSLQLQTHACIGSKWKKWKKRFHQKKRGLGIFISDNVDELKTVAWDNIMIKGSIHQVDITIVNK